MLEMLTLLNKCTRVPRQCDPATLIGTPGLWVSVDNTGKIANIVKDTAPAVSKMLFNGNSVSQYESHDVSVGRISTLETTGARFKTDLFVGTPAQGEKLYVEFAAALASGETPTNNGKLKAISTGTTKLSYTCVAICESYNSAAGYIIAEIISPNIVTLP